MKYKLLIFPLIFLILNFVFLLFAFYKDVKVNKFFNYLDEPSKLNIEEPIFQNENLRKITFDFQSDDDYLGSVDLKIAKLDEIEGKLIFSISDKNTGDILEENTFHFGYFQNYSKFPFGFPEIVNSKNKEYRVTLEFLSSEKLPEFLVDTTNQPVVLTKHVFPKHLIKDNPSKIAEMTFRRFWSVVKTLSILEIIVPTIIVGFLVLSLRNTNKFESKISEDFFNNVFIKINPFWFVAILTVSIAILFALGKTEIVFKYTGYLFLVTLISWIWILLNYLNKVIPGGIANGVARIISNISKILTDRRSKPYLYLVIVAIILLSGLKKNYFFGGDDTRIFYLYPREFLQNFAARGIPGIALSSVDAVIPSATLFAFSLFLTIVKFLLGQLNMQSILYSANLVGGVYFFWRFVNLLIPTKSNIVKFAYFMSACMYVFSIFNFYVLLNSKLISIFLISLFPLILFWYLKYQSTGGLHYLIAICLVVSIFAQINVAAPWFIASILALMPIIIFVSLKNIKRFLTAVGLVTITLLFLNLHWIVLLPFSSSFSPSPLVSEKTIVSEDFRKSNSDGIKAVSEMNNVFLPTLNTYHKKIQDIFNWPYISIYYSWYLKILPLNIIFIAIFLFACIKSRKISLRKPFVYVILSFFSSLYLITVNLTKFGTGFYIFLNNYVPGFVLFRNMYDKFSYAYALVYGLLIAFSLRILLNKIESKNLRHSFLVLTAIAVFVNAWPFLTGKFDKLPIWTTENSYWDIQTLNEDYLNLVNFVKNDKDDGKYLSLPLTTGNAMVIKDHFNDNHYYNGVSPLLALTGRNDFSGLLSFGSASGVVEKYLRERSYDEFGNLLARLNVKYVIVNNNITKDIAQSFVFTNGLYTLQDDEFYAALLGERISEFGKRYAIYKINDKYKNEKIFTTHNLFSFPEKFSPNSYEKISDSLYEIKLEDTKYPFLVFLELNNPGWELTTDNGVVLPKIHDNLAFGYANSWTLSEGNLNQKLRLKYKPIRYFNFAVLVSGVAYIVAIFYMVKVSLSKS